MTFTLHPNFKSKIHVIDLPLCHVILENERHYPWLILIPRRFAASRLIDLTAEDQVQLLKELDRAQRVLWDLFQPTQLNVGAIGNKTPQLHIHVIARFNSDPAWPATVWDHPLRAPYTQEEQEERLAAIQEAFSQEHTRSHPCLN